MWALPTTRMNQGPTGKGNPRDLMKHFHQSLGEEELGLTALIPR